jgi:hypothetical protein
MTFADRSEAGRLLAGKLLHLRGERPARRPTGGAAARAAPAGAGRAGRAARNIGEPRGRDRRDGMPRDAEPLAAIGFYYHDFHQMTDAEVIDLLARAPAPR